MATEVEPTNDARQIQLENIGPIERLTVPCPVNGGVVVITGQNGSGKSQSLGAIDALSSGRKSNLSVRDKQLHGSAEGLGVKIIVGRSTRRTGEAEVVSLEGKMSPADLVDPGIANPEAADARRIKALVQLSGAEPDVRLFYHLAGSQAAFEQIVGPTDSMDNLDLVQLAARVKRDLESAARSAEANAEHAAGHAKAHFEAAGANVPDEHADIDALQKVLEESISAESRIKAMADAAVRSHNLAATAQKAILEAESRYQGQTLELAKAIEIDAASIISKRTREVDDLMSKLTAARAKLAEAERQHERVVLALNSAVEHDQNLAAWRKQVEMAERIELVDQGKIQAFANAVTLARTALQAGMLDNERRGHKSRALQAETLKLEHDKRAKQLREAAKGTDQVLSQCVAKVGGLLRVEADRLVLETRRGATFFGELSEGERWKIALDIAIDAVGKGGLLVIPQAAWEGLDANNRKAIADHLRGTGVVAYTAEATTDEQLQAEVFNG